MTSTTARPPAIGARPRAAPTWHVELVAPAWRVELAGLAVAGALALLAVACLVSSPRGWLLTSDADSVLPALLRGSLAVGQPQHWALSAVLFLPETALFLTIAAVVPTVRAAFLTNAVIDLLLLYCVLRASAGLLLAAAPRPRRVAAALVPLAVVTGLVLLERSPAWDAPELASLLTTTTYYSATVLALVAAPALAARSLRAGRAGRGGAVGLAALTAVSVLTDPLFLWWVVAPLGLVLLVLAGRRLVPWPRFGVALLPLIAGAALGLVGRIPFSPLIARDTARYLDPGQSAHMLLGYYLPQLVQALSTPTGAVSVAVTCGLMVLSGVLAVRAVRSEDRRTALVAGFGVIAPVVVLLGAVLLGTHAVRYLQPVVFAPLPALGIAVARSHLRSPLPRGTLGPVALVLAVLVAVPSTTAIVGAAAGTDASISCLDGWIRASGETGAGRFLTIRGPKAYLADPRRLVQVNADFQPWQWLVNRDDAAVGAVSFVVSDAAAPAPAVPAGAPAPVTTIRCGRYTVTDYGRPVLALGTPTSAGEP